MHLRRIAAASIAALTGLVLVCAVMVSGQAAPPNTPGEPTTEQVYKNIQVFRGLPASRLIPTMSVIAASLGVECEHCHTVPNFEKEDKPAKQKARQMIQMMMAINRENFTEANRVNCFTCHRGSTKPANIPPPAAQLAPPPEPKPTTPASTVEEVLAHYEKAVGGREAAEKLTTRVQEGTLEGGGGFHATVEIAAKAPNKLLTKMTFARGASMQGFDGTIAWAKNPAAKEPREIKGPDLVRIRREAQFLAPFLLRQNYVELKYAGVEKIGERDVHVLDGATPDGSREKLYFDAETGLLIRLQEMHETLIGQSPLQVDYEDYREVDGVRLPFIVRRARPDFLLILRIQEVRHNVPMGDAEFAKPAVPQALTP